MKQEKIKELFRNNSGENDYRYPTMDIDNFTQAINQAELEWYKKLEKKLANMKFSIYGLDYLKEFKMYQTEIRNKIKELEK